MEDAKPQESKPTPKATQPSTQGKAKIEPLDNISNIEEQINEKEAERVAETIEKREIADQSTTVEEVVDQKEEGTATENVEEVFEK